MKRILTFIVILFVCGISFAQIPGSIGQNNYYNPLNSFGFKGGLNFSNLSSEYPRYKKSKLGFIVGFFYENNLFDQFSVL